MRAGVRAACAFVAFVCCGLGAANTALANPTPTAAQQRARDLLYRSGDAAAALQAATAADDRWVAGLAAFRLNDFTRARVAFESFAGDVRYDDWNRAAGAYWAARAAIADGHPEAAPALLRAAASYSRTFYGLLAQRQLGLDSAVGADLIRTNTLPLAQEPLETAEADAPALEPASDGAVLQQAAFVTTEPQAATAEAATAPASEPDASAEFDAVEDPNADYPMPSINPVGGFTLDRAIVFAIVRQESRFNPRARSRAGAAGLMQLMPGTAAQFQRVSGVRGSMTNPSVNLRVGQDYFSYLLGTRTVGGDVLRAVAAYNGGPGTVIGAVERMGTADPDALMLMECLPYAETRAYVERVMANYWIYRRLMGRDSATLDAVVTGQRAINASLDR